MQRYFDEPKIKLKSSSSESNKLNQDNQNATLNLITAAKIIGLSIQEIRMFTLGEFMTLLELRFSSLNQNEKSKVREATQADIDAFLC